VSLRTSPSVLSRVRPTAAVAAAVIAVASAVAARTDDAVAPAGVPLASDTLDAWRAHILPGADELAYASIPWHVTFADGLEAARAEGRPLLLWAMNGHPLGCT